MAAAGEDAREPRRAAPAGDAIPEDLRREFEDLGLSPYEARVLLAMLQLGPANTLELSQVSGVPRTSTYPVLKTLTAKQLAYRVPGEGPARWACGRSEEVLERLDSAEQERMREHRSRIERVGEMLAEAFPDERPAVEPPLRLLYSSAQYDKAFERLASQVKAEALLYVKPPYAPRGDELHPLVADMASRVETRVLYEAESEQHGASPSIAAMHACRSAGGLARVVDELPMEMAVFDRQAALVTLNDAAKTVAIIEDATFAEVLVEAFKYRWGGGASCGCHDA